MSEYYQRPGTNDKRFDDEMRRVMLKACNKHNLEKGLMVLYLRQQEILNLLRKSAPVQTNSDNINELKNEVIVLVNNINTLAAEVFDLKQRLDSADSKKDEPINEKQPKFRVGGKIFCINENATGATYTFYDREGNVITDVQVGDEPYEYSISGTSFVNKYYIFHNELFKEKCWEAFSNRICKIPSIWDQIKDLCDNRVGGCNDWLVPSKNEVEALRTATDRDGNALVTWFDNNYIWSSSEHSSDRSLYWDYIYQSWLDSDKFATLGVFGIREF